MMGNEDRRLEIDVSSGLIASGAMSCKSSSPHNFPPEEEATNLHLKKPKISERLHFLDFCFLVGDEGI